MTPTRPLKMHELIEMMKESTAARRELGIEPRKYKKYCKRGHERIPENLYDNGSCRICQKMIQRARYRLKNNLCKRGHPQSSNGLTCPTCNYRRDRKLIAYVAWYMSFDVPPIAFEYHPGGWKLWLDMTVGRLDGRPTNTDFPIHAFKVDGMNVTHLPSGTVYRVPTFTGEL